MQTIKPAYIFAAAILAVVLFIAWRKGAFKPAAAYGDTLNPQEPTPGEGAPMTTAQAQNAARAFHLAFEGWNATSAGQVQQMDRINALTDANVISVHNAHINLYGGESLAQLVTAEWYFSPSAQDARNRFLARLAQVGAA